MGNDLFSHYQIEKNPFLSGGHLNMWKIYHATHKERKQPACLFVFEKKTLEQYPQSEREEILTLLKKEATSLTQFKHPKILSIVEPLIEDKYLLGFITEAFSFSLNSWLTKSNPSKLEIKLIIKELCKALSFLHNKCHIVHANLNPNSIFIVKDNRVKLSGMNFAISDPQSSGEHITLTSFNNGETNPNLNFASHELVYQSKAYYPSDIYSIGLLMLKCLNEKDFIQLNQNTPDAYKKTISNKLDHQFTKITLETEDNEIIKATLLQNESKRPTVKGLLQYDWFTDYKLKALSFIEDLTTNDITQNYNFLKCLPSSLKLFDNKIITTRFLPALLNGLKIEALINPILPSVFAICDPKNSNINFEKEVWPQLKEVFQFKTIPTASLYLLLSKINFIGERIPNAEFSTHCFSLICKSMDCGVSKIQSVISDKLPFVSNLIDSQVLVNEVYPRIIQILYYTKSTTLKAKLLSSLKDLVQILDHQTINEKLIGDLEKIQKSDSSYQTTQGLILIFEEIAKVAYIHNISTKIIPNLVAMLMNGAISKKLFEKINEVVQMYVNKIRSSREKEYCKDEDYDIDNSTQERIAKEINDQGKQLMIFFGVNDREMNHLSPSNNNSTSVNSTSSELNGDGLHEEYISSINNKAEFIENLLDTKIKKNESKIISSLLSSNETNLNTKGNKTIKTDKAMPNKGNEFNLIDDLLENTNDFFSQNNLDFLINNQVKDYKRKKQVLITKDSETNMQQVEISLNEKSNNQTSQKKNNKNAWDVEEEEDNKISIDTKQVHISKEENRIEEAKIIQPIIKETKSLKSTAITTKPVTPIDKSKSIKSSKTGTINNNKSIGFTIDDLLDD